MGYRAMDLSKIKDKEMKKHYKQLQEDNKLPDMRSEEEKEEDFAEALWQMLTICKNMYILFL